MTDIRTRIESELEVNSYLQDLRYALSHNAKITFQVERLVDQNRNPKYTNQFTVADLFPDENPVTAIKRECLFIMPKFLSLLICFHIEKEV